MATPYTPSSDVPSYASHRVSQSFDPHAPPPPPPKPSSQEVSRQGTPAAGPALPPPPSDGQRSYAQAFEDGSMPTHGAAQNPPPQDPGPQWLPKLLEDKSKQDLADILNQAKLVSALAHAKSTAHPSSLAAEEPLNAALSENISLATHLNELESRLSHLRASTQARLLSTHSLERQWRQKQSDMDRALSPFSPSSLYQRLNQGVQEQEMVCRALEESFLEGDGGVATEREITEWVRRYREAKKLFYSRTERKERWDEGRVGGWR